MANSIMQVCTVPIIKSTTIKNQHVKNTAHTIRQHMSMDADTIPDIIK